MSLESELHKLDEVQTNMSNKTAEVCEKHVKQNPQICQSLWKHAREILGIAGAEQQSAGSDGGTGKTLPDGTGKTPPEPARTRWTMRRPSRRKKRRRRQKGEYFRSKLVEPPTAPCKNLMVGTTALWCSMFAGFLEMFAYFVQCSRVFLSVSLHPVSRNRV